MRRELSPLERSRQILKEMEREERRKKVANIEESDPRRQQVPVLSEEGTSMEGQPQRIMPGTVYEEEIADHPLLKFDQQSIVQGFIFSEVLSKPVSKRRGRW